ncbi:MAG: protein translocase subunit SecF [Chloroflexota bacterium]|nr:protein translocase subunit SecF [Chloroflexota bacterium]
MNFSERRPWFFLISLLVILPGIVFLILAPGLNPGIDFTGGSSLTMQFPESSGANQKAIREKLQAIGYPESTVQNLGNSTIDEKRYDLFFLRTKTLDETKKDILVDNLNNQFSPEQTNTVLSFDLVSAVVAQETVISACWAVLAAALGIFFYVWWAFRKVPRPIRYGLAAIVALLHDALIVVGIFAILGYFLDTEVNTMFLIALLTVIGYSVNDTIVVFDKIRENVLTYTNRPFPEVVNLSISETMGRSLNTSFTLLVTLLALLLFGGTTIREFLYVLIIGVIVGTYSSIAIATQVLVSWDQKTIGKLISS